MAGAKKLTKGSVHGMTLAAGSYTGNSHFAFINAAQNGADFFDAAGKPTLKSEGVVDGISRYLDLMQTDKAAMVLSQNNANSSIASQGMKADQFGVVAFRGRR